jgi:hypothetical protein
MKSLLACALILSSTLGAQNVGIGTTSPTGPLSFASTLGNKIVLWGDGNSNHYGVGVQGGLLQFYADAAAANIAFGYGKSIAFTERMRILNGGNYDGMILNGRLLIRNGSNDAVGGGGGVWLYKADNSAFLGFMGTQNNQNIGFYGGPAGWGFTYDAINSRVGIGNNNPNAPLAFGAVGGKKITLYPGTLGDAGFGIAPNRLQINLIIQMPMWLLVTMQQVCSMNVLLSNPTEPWPCRVIQVSRARYFAAMAAPHLPGLIYLVLLHRNLATAALC